MDGAGQGVFVVLELQSDINEGKGDWGCRSACECTADGRGKASQTHDVVDVRWGQLVETVVLRQPSVPVLGVVPVPLADWVDERDTEAKR